LHQKYWRTQNAQINTENIHKYLQQRNQAKLIAKQAKLIAKIKLGRTYWEIIKILALV
jgi:hypothetical protein